MAEEPPAQAAVMPWRGGGDRSEKRGRRELQDLVPIAQSDLPAAEQGEVCVAAGAGGAATVGNPLRARHHRDTAGGCPRPGFVKGGCWCGCSRHTLSGSGRSRSCRGAGRRRRVREWHTVVDGTVGIPGVLKGKVGRGRGGGEGSGWWLVVGVAGVKGGVLAPAAAACPSAPWGRAASMTAAPQRHRGGPHHSPWQAGDRGEKEESALMTARCLSDASSLSCLGS